MESGGDRRVSRASPCLGRDRGAALRVFCRGVRQARRDRGIRAARRDAVDPDADPPDQRGPRGGRKPVHPRRHATGNESPRRWSRRCSSLVAPSNGGASAMSPTPPSASANASRHSTPKTVRHGPGQPGRKQGLRLPEDPARRRDPTDCRLFGRQCTPQTPWAPAWSATRAPARPITNTGAARAPAPAGGRGMRQARTLDRRASRWATARVGATWST
jgi:hypothetical protein